MGKKRSRAHQVSKGERRPLDRAIQKATRREYRNSFERHMNQLRAHLAGKPTMITIANPNPQETNKPFIRVPGKEYFNKTGR